MESVHVSGGKRSSSQDCLRRSDGREFGLIRSPLGPESGKWPVGPEARVVEVVVAPGFPPTQLSVMSVCKGLCGLVHTNPLSTRNSAVLRCGSVPSIGLGNPVLRTRWKAFHSHPVLKDLVQGSNFRYAVNKHDRFFFECLEPV